MAACPYAARVPLIFRVPFTVQPLNGVLALLLFATQARSWTVLAEGPGGGQYAAGDQLNRSNVKLLEQAC